MGTIVTIDIRTALPADRLADAVAAATAVLRDADATFSMFRPDSWARRLAAGEQSLDRAPARVQEVYRLAEQCRLRTGGAFDPGWRRDGTLDPTGLVKGWAAEAASAALLEAGAPDHCVNAAGDVRVRGQRASGQPWRVGIADPLDRTRLVAVVDRGGGAVATSGTAEQGAHVVDPRTELPAVALASVTVVGADLALADAYATAGLAAGPDAARLLTDLATEGWSWLTVTATGATACSADFPGRIAPTIATPVRHAGVSGPGS
jgi:FAD:protein FMN transferase